MDSVEPQNGSNVIRMMHGEDVPEQEDIEDFINSTIISVHGCVTAVFVMTAAFIICCGGIVGCQIASYEVRKHYNAPSPPPPVPGEPQLNNLPLAIQR